MNYSLLWPGSADGVAGGTKAGEVGTGQKPGQSSLFVRPAAAESRSGWIPAARTVRSTGGGGTVEEVALSANDITALLTGLLLLMREGELRRGEIIYLFCAYDQNQAWERDARILQEVANDAYQIEAESNI